MSLALPATTRFYQGFSPALWALKTPALIKEAASSLWALTNASRVNIEFGALGKKLTFAKLHWFAEAALAPKVPAPFKVLRLWASFRLIDMPEIDKGVSPVSLLDVHQATPLALLGTEANPPAPFEEDYMSPRFSLSESLSGFSRLANEPLSVTPLYSKVTVLSLTLSTLALLWLFLRIRNLLSLRAATRLCLQRQVQW